MSAPVSFSRVAIRRREFASLRDRHFTVAESPRFTWYLVAGSAFVFVATLVLFA